MTTDSAPLSLFLQDALDGDKQAENRFCLAVYDELHDVAKRAVHRGTRSLQASALVNELFLKMSRRQGIKHAHSRQYFYTVAMDQMRKRLIDYHRKRKRKKAGGDFDRVPFDEAMDRVLCDFEERNGCDVESLETELAQLQATNERACRVVIHRFYGGLTNNKTAEALGVSVSTVEGNWRLARASCAATCEPTRTQNRGRTLP